MKNSLLNTYRDISLSLSLKRTLFSLETIRCANLRNISSFFPPLDRSRWMKVSTILNYHTELCRSKEWKTRFLQRYQKTIGTFVNKNRLAEVSCMYVCVNRNLINYIVIIPGRRNSVYFCSYFFTLFFEYPFIFIPLRTMKKCKPRSTGFIRTDVN